MVGTSESPRKSNDVYENVSDGYGEQGRAGQGRDSLRWGRLSWNNYVAYVTQLGFYAFYIDCHHVTLTDRKKVVNWKGRIRARPADLSTQTHSHSLTHTRDQTRAEILRILKQDVRRDRCCCCRVKSQWALRVDFRVVRAVWVLWVTQVASSRKKNIKIRLPFWY